MLVREVMTTDVLTVEASTPLKSAAQLLARRGISGVPVVDADGAVVGVLSEADILVQERGPSLHTPGLLSFVFDHDAAWRDKIGAHTVGEAMSKPAISVAPHVSVSEAATRMLDQQVNRLPVIKNGRLVGIVTRADLVRAFVRTNEEIEREIREEVFGRALWLSPDRLTVTVADGVATVYGALDSPADEQTMARLVKRVPGVVSVVSHVEVAKAGSR